MEIQLKQVERLATSYDVTRAIAKVLHGQSFVAAHCPQQSRPVNFSVVLTPDTVPNSIRNGGAGTLTVPSVRLGQDFLRFLHTRRVKVTVLGRNVQFSSSPSIPRRNLIDTLTKVPYQDPDIIEAKQEIFKELDTQLPVQTLQFGVFVKHSSGRVFSPEWEEDYQEHGDARLAFEHQHKLLRLKIGDHSDTIAHSVVITFFNMKRIFIGWDYGQPFILFLLTTPPAFESECMYRDTERQKKNIRHRVSSFDEAHGRVAPYAHQVRVVLKNGADLQQFERMCQKAETLSPVRLRDRTIEVQKQDIFSSANLRKVDRWLATLDWPVAFQCDALLRNLRLNTLELLALQSQVEDVSRRGSRYASQILRHYHTVLRSLRKDETFLDAFTRAGQEYEQLIGDNNAHSDTRFFNAHYVSFTPTAIRLDGPYLHQSNRVIRKYADYQEFFIRVAFRDEDHLQYRWDREVDGATFVRERVGQILHEGFTIAGRDFQFLGYSQSQLRSHCVFAVSPFQHPEKGLVTAQTIREEVGIFDDIRRCPALYAARVSQAFSGTEDSVWLCSDEWDEMDDVKHHGRTFTDGVGTISSELAKKIWQSLKIPSAPFEPAAFQIRFGGYKGMVSVDPRLVGTMMRLRPSMRKFHVFETEAMPLEIARAFVYPGHMYLNRQVPLIQILEDLGIPKEVFLRLQQEAVANVQIARKSLLGFAGLLESHALGKAFSLSYLMRSLDSIGCGMEHHDPSRTVGTLFFRGLVDTAVLSVLRDLKHNARIPVPQGWNLVGVADEDGILGPGQIYACIWEQDMQGPKFLNGPVMISRSPTVHPGDVQMVMAIGPPPPGSMYEANPMANVVVFPCEGKRDLASCLGGGDLDGDLYLVCQFHQLLVQPAWCHAPGDYLPATKKYIDRPSTIDDVADFVVEYINSDMVGLLSTNHLILSDQSSFGTLDRDCLKLAELCSIAVDYPKSGTPVNMADTPRFLIPYKPDWKSGEVINPRWTDYYESSRAIGHLFRAIVLEESTTELSFDPTSILKDMSKPSGPRSPPVDAITSTLLPIIEDRLRDSQHVMATTIPIEDYLRYLEHGMAATIPTLFSKYCLQLKYICVTHTLSHDPSIKLKEEEVVVGTILAKCSQTRWRKDRIEEMRINTSHLVRLVSTELEGSDPLETLGRAWAAWRYTLEHPGEFGHRSFGLIALECIFRAMDDLPDRQKVRV
ncbi:RdRP-domain-containing protein [Gautieria morchelliformis]|nr:RdRP-domain-containing protein [Gautieria morchelliformis]